MGTVEPAINVFIDNVQALNDLTLDLPREYLHPNSPLIDIGPSERLHREYYYPKPSSRGLRELNRDARISLYQLELTIKQGVGSGILRPNNLPHVVMMLLNDAGRLMNLLYAMRNRGEVSRKTFRRGRRLVKALWVSVGNPPHNEF